MSNYKIIYISGYGRSGSTLLSILLNISPNVYNIGEIDNLFSLKDDDLTQYWKNLKHKQLKNNNIKKLDKRFSSISWILKIKKGEKLFNQFWMPLLNDFVIDYKAKIVVDASKSTYKTFCRPLYYYKNNIPIKIVHLVRDPDGVAKSYRKGRNDSNSKYLKKPKKGGAYRALINWFIVNVLTSVIYKKTFVKNEFYVLSYDKLMSDYNNEMIKLMNFLELDISEELFLKKIPIAEDLSFSGNRIRLKKEIEIKPYLTDKLKGGAGALSRVLKSVYKLIENDYK